MQGHCLCKAISVNVTGDLLFLYNCHCRQCRAFSGASYATNATVLADDLTISDPGNHLSCYPMQGGKRYFCGNCGSRIYHAFGDGDEPLSLKAGSLDETKLLEPIGHIWTCRAHNWLELHRSGKPCYDREPESFDDLLKAWRSS